MPSSKNAGVSKRVSKPKYGDGTMGLLPCQTQIVLLAAIYQSGSGEADFDRIASELKITAASARRYFTGAKTTIRRYLKAKNGDDSSEDDIKQSTGKSTSPAPSKSKSKSKSKGKGKSSRDYDSDEDILGGQDLAF